MAEGVLARRLGRAEEPAVARRSSDAVSSARQIDHGAQQLRRHVLPDHGSGLEHVLVGVREPIDAEARTA